MACVSLKIGVESRSVAANVHLVEWGMLAHFYILCVEEKKLTVQVSTYTIRLLSDCGCQFESQ